MWTLGHLGVWFPALCLLVFWSARRLRPLRFLARLVRRG